MKEHRRLEYKENDTNTFLKTVSAYANYDGGEIVFGISDKGDIVGVGDPEKFRLNIENKINDSISPQPEFLLHVTDGGKTVTLHVYPGSDKPYMYRLKAYKRNDTSTIETDPLELRRLILEGKNTGYEELKSEKQTLSFDVFECYLKNSIGIECITKDIVKSLGLYTDVSGYNIAAELLSDENSFPGVEIVKFGEDISEIRRRESLKGKSVLSVIEDTIKVYEDYYVFEKISETVRTTTEMIPRDAFRETIANSIVHRTWDVTAPISVYMFDDRIEVTSPGGLVPGLSKDEFLSGGLSIPRNRILTENFLRMRLIEKLGTGILRIKNAYKENAVKPAFDIRENSIKVTLPIIIEIDLTADEMTVYKALSKTRPMSTGEITEMVPFGRSKVLYILKQLCERNIIKENGTGRGTKYIL